MVLGAGHSAANTLISLGRLRQAHPDTQILWGLRGVANPVRLYGGGAADELPARGQLGTSLRRFVENGDIRILENASVTSLSAGAQLTVEFAGRRSLNVDFLVPATGFRPDLAPLAELRLDLDQIVEAPRQLAPLIDPEFHSCGTVTAHGARVLAHPEPDFFVVGMKSYGRAPTFLMATGYEQVRSVAAALAGTIGRRSRRARLAGDRGLLNGSWWVLRFPEPISPGLELRTLGADDRLLRRAGKPRTHRLCDGNRARTR